jgi:dTDP-4-amino-4,6-dideoxygalactose transaminase
MGKKLTNMSGGKESPSRDLDYIMGSRFEERTGIEQKWVTDGEWEEYMNNRPVKLFVPNSFPDEWTKELHTTFKSGWLAQSGKVDEFEKEFGQKFGYPYSVAVNSGTASLELAFHLAGIHPGDKVVTSVLTCTATNLPLVHLGAKIEFVDINKEDMTMDYNDLFKKVNGAKAIVVVNLGGLRCDDRIFDLAEKMRIPVIIDACQSLGIPEPRGDYVCYSFQAIKHFTTGDGGMLVVRSSDDYNRAKKLRWFGIDREQRQRLNFNFTPTNREMCMNMDEPGWKLHMNDIQATMGLVGLKHSDESLEHRIMLGDIFREKLTGKIPFVLGGSHWLMAVMVEDRDWGVMDRVKDRNIECDLIHLRNDIFTPFGSKRQDLPNMNWVEQRYMYVPMHIKMKPRDVENISRILLEEIECKPQ